VVKGSTVSEQIPSAISFPTRSIPDRGPTGSWPLPSAKAFDLLFLLNRMVRMKLLPVFLIMNGHKIICLKMENVTWLDSLNYLAMPLRKLPEACGLTVVKSW